MEDDGQRYSSLLLEIPTVKVTLASYHTAILRHGGPQTQILQTKRYLEERGVDVELFNPWAERATALDSDLFHLYASNFGTYDLARYLNAHLVRFVSSPIFYTRRSPRTIRFVSAVEKVIRKTGGFWSDYGFSRDICHWSKMVLPNTASEASLITQGLGIPVSKTEVVPNGVEERFEHGDPDLFVKKYGINDFILNVGHIGVERKNTLALIRALRKIDHPAVIIGRVYPSEEGNLCLMEAEADKNLTLIQGIDHDSEMLASAYAACSVFALPAKYETPGIAALEAGLAGAQVVITPHGGTKDYFEDMATYVDPYSIPSIERGIRSALDTGRDSRLQEHVRKNFLWQNVAERTAYIYRKILDSTPAL